MMENNMTPERMKELDEKIDRYFKDHPRPICEDTIEPVYDPEKAKELLAMLKEVSKILKRIRNERGI